MMSNSKIYKSNILVTGGAGFVGSYLVEQLLQKNPDKIYIVDNLFRGTMQNMKNFISNQKIEFINGDIRDEALISNILKKTDYVFHLAALRINACAANPREGFDVMVNGTFKLFDLAITYKIKKIIYSSSASVYGMAQNFPTKETESPYDNQTFYGAAKLFGEQLLRSYKFMYGLDFVSLRYFNIYGPRMDTDGKYTEVMIRWLDAIRENVSPVIMGNGSTSMDFIYVEDVARANILALDSKVSGEVFNIGTQTETSLKKLLMLLLSVNNSKLKPKFQQDNKINPVQRRMADIQKGEKMLNFHPNTDLNKGLTLLSKWYFNKYDSNR